MADKVISYNTAIITALTWALQQYFAQQEVYERYNVDGIRIESEYPLDLQQYPFIQTGYQSTRVQPSSLSPTMHTHGDTNFAQRREFIGDGDAKIYVYANNEMECSRLADIIWAATACAPTPADMVQEGATSFMQFIDDNQWIGINANTQALSQGPIVASQGAVWNEDLPMAYTDLSFPLTCEFFYTIEAVPTYIKKIDLEATPLPFA